MLFQHTFLLRAQKNRVPFEIAKRKFSGKSEIRHAFKYVAYILLDVGPISGSSTVAMDAIDLTIFRLLVNQPIQLFFIWNNRD